MADGEQKKADLKSIAFSAGREIAAVIVAILLALAINEWWEDHERSQRKSELLDKLYVELDRNLDRLRVSHAFHSKHLDYIRAETRDRDALTDDDYRRIYREMYRQGILRPALLTDSNWEIAKLTDLISYIDLEELSALSNVFALFEAHEYRWRQNGDAQTLANLEDDPRKIIEVYFQVLNETWWVEKAVIAELETVLGKTKPEGD